MVAPTGNKFWELRSTHGRAPIFKSPEDLWNAACEYFEWVHNNPLYEAKAFNCGEAGIQQENLPKMRAMTIQGLCFFLDISDDTWANYSKKQDFLAISDNIKRVIYTQKFEGASAGLLNASLIAREINIASNSSSDIDLEIKKLELEKLRKEVKPEAVRAPDEDYKLPLSPDEEIPDEPIL